jgi:phosphonate transport system substrate-binding protein
VLVARPSLGLRSVEDLKARAGEIVFSFEEPVSTSGHLVPRSFFHEIGLDAERAFKQTLFSPDSTVSLLALRAGRLDVAAVSRNSLDRAIEKRRISRDEVSVIWTSAPVLANVVAIRRALPDAFKARVRDALVQMASASPEQWAVVARQYSQPVACYLPADDQLLERFRTAIRNVPGLQISL